MSDSKLKFSFTISTVLLLLVSSVVSASTELDRKYVLESVGVLKSWDNVDGLFSDYVAAAYKDYFAKQSRFTLQDLSKADTILSRSKIPYNRLINDGQVLSQVAKVTRSDTIIRTTITKEGPQYRFMLDWLLAPNMELVANESFVQKSAALGDVQEALQAALDRLFARVPFVATVTGRDNNSITINIGANAKVKRGDVLTIATLDDVKKHPLLKAVVDWRLSVTGHAEIEEVEERIAFGRVIDEEGDRKVAKNQKVTQISTPPPKVEAPAPSTEGEPSPEEIPRLGWVAGGLGLGSFGRQYSNTAAPSSFSGSGFSISPRIEGQLWLNQEWFAELGFGFGFWGYSQDNLLTGAESTGAAGTSSLTTIRIAGGYNYLVSGDFFGPKGWVKLGYQSSSYSLPFSAADGIAPVSFGSVFLGIGADFPVRHKWSAILNLDFGLLTSASETGSISGKSQGSTQVNFFVGALYRYKPRISFRGGIEVVGHSSQFGTTTNLTQRTIAITPSLVYSF